MNMFTLHILHVLGQCRNSYKALPYTLVWGLGSSFNFTWYIASLHDLQKLVRKSAVSLLMSILNML